MIKKLTDYAWLAAALTVIFTFISMSMLMKEDVRVRRKDKLESMKKAIEEKLEQKIATQMSFIKTHVHPETNRTETGLPK